MKRLIILIILLTGLKPALIAQNEISGDERMQWWREARFGMFIHWGLYSIPAGEWNGKQIDGIGEWIMKRAQIPAKDYRQLAAKFNPVKFNAHDFVATAKNAGMKYITITSKHHDGFAMFQSEASAYNIVDATPYGKDVIKALAEECREQGLKLCFYYSQSRDWNEPNGLDNDWDFPKERNFQQYLDKKVKPQLTELLTNYGPVGLIWFDTPMSISREQAQSLKDLVRKLQPACIISGRLGGGVETDYLSTGDNVIPATVVPGDWEVPATLNNTWGFKKNDHEWKSPEVLTRLLFDIAAKGGNYLLNVGPDSEGVIPPESVKILAKVGEWMNVNSECIYGTQASPFNMEFKWGNITQKPGKLYLGIFDWPATDFYLEGLKNKVKKVYLLADKHQKAIPFEEIFDAKTDHHRLKIDLPRQAPDPVVSVVVAEIEGPADVEKTICQQADRSILLPGISAVALKDNQPAELKFTAPGGGVYWRDAAVSLTWKFMVEKPGTYQIDLVTTETGSHGSPVWEGGQKIKIRCAGQSREVTVVDEQKEINSRSPYWKLIHTSGGGISFDQPGIYEMSLIPVGFPENKIGFTFKEILLLPRISGCASAQDPVYWNSNLLINPYRTPLPSGCSGIEYLDLDKDGDPDVLRTFTLNETPVQWIDDDDDMKDGDMEGDMDNDCLMIDRNKDGLYGHYGDLVIDWNDTDDDGIADMQVVVDNVPESKADSWYGGIYMWMLDLDKDNILNYIDWNSMKLRCWVHDGQSDFFEDYSGRSIFLKVHSSPERMNDPRLNWENPFLFYDPDQDGLTEMAVRLVDDFTLYQDTSRILVPLSGKITYAALTYDLDNDNAPGNEFDFDFTLGFSGGGFDYLDQVHRFKNMRGLPDADSFFLDPRWRQLTELVYPDHESAIELVFQRGKWKSAQFVFDEDDDCARWERVEFYDPLDPFRIGEKNNGLDHNRQADASGDRGEWDKDNSGNGRLYISRFDGRLHLFGAEWGAWRIDQNAWSYQGMGGIVDGYGPGRLQKPPEKFATVTYSDEDNNGFIDKIRYDLDGDTVFENSVSLISLGIDDRCDLIDMAAMDYGSLHEMYKKLAANMWNNAELALQVAHKKGLQTNWYALLKHPKSVRQQYHCGWWLQFYLFNDLVDQAKRKGNPGEIEQIMKAYYSGDWKILLSQL